jgi:hypothetical protein
MAQVRIRMKGTSEVSRSSTPDHALHGMDGADQGRDHAVDDVDEEPDRM